MQARRLVKQKLLAHLPGMALPLYAHFYRLRDIEPELRLLPRLCAREGLALDVGAHEGVYSYFMLRQAARVIAFEPNPVLAAHLRRTFGARLDVRETALSDTAGSARLHIPQRGSEAVTSNGSIEASAAEPQSDVFTVSTTPLDQLIDGLGRVGFIKIDVEGHELSVLRGAAGLLRRDRPNLLVEAEERHRREAVSSIHDFLGSLGYRGYFLEQDRPQPIGRFSPQRHQPIPQPPGVRYINNFIFLPDGTALQREWGAAQ
jgi:FkbM family methyltransferase